MKLKLILLARYIFTFLLSFLFILYTHLLTTCEESNQKTTHLKPEQYVATSILTVLDTAYIHVHVYGLIVTASLQTGTRNE
jgi:hypothetical protein